MQFTEHFAEDGTPFLAGRHDDRDLHVTFDPALDIWVAVDMETWRTRFYWHNPPIRVAPGVMVFPTVARAA